MNVLQNNSGLPQARAPSCTILGHPRSALADSAIDGRFNPPRPWLTPTPRRSGSALHAAGCEVLGTGGLNRKEDREDAAWARKRARAASWWRCASAHKPTADEGVHRPSHRRLRTYQAHPMPSAPTTAVTEMATDRIASLRMPMPRTIAGQAVTVASILGGFAPPLRKRA